MSIRQKRALVFWAFVALSTILFFYSLPYRSSTAQVDGLATAQPKVNEGIQVDLLGEPVVEIAPQNVPATGAAATVETVDTVDTGAPVEDVEVNVDATITDDVPEYIEETLDAAPEDEDTAAPVDVLDGTRTAVEQLMDNMDRDHATLEHEVLGLGHKQGEAESTAGGSNLTHTEVVEAQALWQQLNHMYKNVKGAAKDMQGFLSRVTGGDIASKHAAELLAAAKAADEDEDIKKINLVHTAKRGDTNNNVHANKKLEMREELRHKNENNENPLPWMKDTTISGNNVYKAAEQ